MRFTFCPLYSGSSGNASLVCGGGDAVLIDAGLSGRTVSEGLLEIGAQPEMLKAILVSHEHSDHIRGVGILSRKYRLPVYATCGTWQAMERQVGDLPPGCRREFEPGEDFYIGDLAVSAFSIPHDAAEPVGYRVYYGGRSVATATDIGHMTKRVLDALWGADLVLMESNHDPGMLSRNEHYSAALKSRIAGARGHLSNEDCGKALIRLSEGGLRRAILGHLSRENNTPELALSTVLEELKEAGCEMRLDMAFRDHVGGVYTLA